MKKKFLLFGIALSCVFLLSACATKKELDLNNYIIEQRDNLYVAMDDLYSATLSSGLREENYSFDGAITNKVPFAILTFSKLDNLPLANDTYSYTITIGEEQLTGSLEKSQLDNTYSVDLEKEIANDAVINLQIKFTGYNFNKEMENISSSFQVDCPTAIKIATKELKNEIKNTLNENNKIEVVTKILKDYSSSEVKAYYWYIGVVATSGETFGILIDSSTGNIIAKKV